MRRMMYRLASEVAKRRNCKAISNGESVGQVASQTLESMYTINEVTNMPVIRPVVCLDKEEIINIARRIDTFEISIRPYEDCCTIFAPKNPKTRPSLEKSKELEKLSISDTHNSNKFISSLVIFKIVLSPLNNFSKCIIKIEIDTLLF